MKRKPVAEISEDDEGIESIDGVIDAHISVNEAVVKCRATRWFAPPGSVIKVANHGPYTGRWLVFNIWRDLFSTDCEVKLHQPEAAKPEPAPEEASVQTSGGGESLILGSHISGGTARERIVEAAKWGLAHKAEFRYLQYRPMAKSLFEKFALTHSDCSAFATLCYKAANVKDPNGANYNGQGFTGTLQAHGTKTNEPQPGDLVFYRPGAGPGGSAGHVAVYIGEGKVIELGGTPGPNEESINYLDIVEVRSYNLETPNPISPKPSKHGEPPTPLVPQSHGQFEGLREPSPVG
jgi:cell wall-associated NlpC family hydrolase